MATALDARSGVILQVYMREGRNSKLHHTLSHSVLQIFLMDFKCRLYLVLNASMINQPERSLYKVFPSFIQGCEEIILHRKQLFFLRLQYFTLPSFQCISTNKRNNKLEYFSVLLASCKFSVTSLKSPTNSPQKVIVCHVFLSFDVLIR